MKIRAAVPSGRLVLMVALALLAAMALTLLPASPAAAAPLVGKDGKIHACYKWKGKKKGALRLVRHRKVRCPRKWKKVSWYAAAPTVPSVPAIPGPPGPQGERGLPGVVDPATVEQLEGKISQLTTKVEQLETLVSALGGVLGVPTLSELLPAFSSRS